MTESPAQPKTLSYSRDDVLNNLQFFFGDPVSPEKLRDYSEHHALTCARAGIASRTLFVRRAHFTHRASVRVCVRRPLPRRVRILRANNTSLPSRTASSLSSVRVSASKAIMARTRAHASRV